MADSENSDKSTAYSFEEYKYWQNDVLLIQFVSYLYLNLKRRDWGISDNSQSSVLPHALDYALAHSTDISNLGRDSTDSFAFRQSDEPTSCRAVPGALAALASYGVKWELVM